MTTIGLKQEQQTENCDKHGSFVSEHYRTEVLDWWTRCPECAERAEEERAEQIKEHERKLRDTRIATLRESAHIPSRYRRKTLADYSPACDGEKQALSVAQNYVVNFAEHLATGRCLLFSGRPGTGKTFLGCAIGETLIQNERSVRYETVNHLIRSIRAPWNDANSGETVDDVLTRFQRFDLLILDEVGAGSGSDAELVQLTELIDVRYSAMRPMVVISNYTPKELSGFLGDRALDRLRDNGGKVVVFDWPSRRGC